MVQRPYLQSTSLCLSALQDRSCRLQAAAGQQLRGAGGACQRHMPGDASPAAVQALHGLAQPSLHVHCAAADPDAGLPLGPNAGGATAGDRHMRILCAWVLQLQMDVVVQVLQDRRRRCACLGL